MQSLTILLSLACVLAIAPVRRSIAQAANPPGFTSVTLVSASNLPRGAKVVVERRATLHPRDVILVDLDRATPHDLAAAVQTLAALDQRGGEHAGSSLRASPKSYTPPPGFEQSRFGREMKLGLVRLLAAPETTLAGIGRVQSVAITVVQPRVGKFKGH
jgi:hypothetical protein